MKVSKWLFCCFWHTACCFGTLEILKCCLILKHTKRLVSAKRLTVGNFVFLRAAGYCSYSLCVNGISRTRQVSKCAVHLGKWICKGILVLKLIEIYEFVIIILNRIKAKNLAAKTVKYFLKSKQHRALNYQLTNKQSKKWKNAFLAKLLRYDFCCIKQILMFIFCGQRQMQHCSKPWASGVCKQQIRT